jgi:hypothetical protein
MMLASCRAFLTTVTRSDLIALCLMSWRDGKWVPTGLTISLNGAKPVFDDESPEPIILSLNTSGLLSGHHFLERS